LSRRAIVAGAISGSSRTFRLDPLDLPARAIGQVRSLYVIDRERIIVRRPTRGGQDLTVSVPVSAYDGISVRMAPAGDGADLRIFVELRHRDPDLTVPLVIADRPEEIVADWRAWGETLDLPLLVVGQDGTVRRADELAARSAVVVPTPRRRRAFLAGRRPRFLRRRKTGRRGPLEHIAGREIIAPY
jgi:hypothetical protein